MNKLISILVLVFILCAANQVYAKGISSPSKRISQSGNYVFMEGRWKETTQGGSRIIPRINTTYIICDKMNVVCNETIAKLTTPQDNELSPDKLLFTQEFTYKILSWNDGTILAK